MRSTLNKQVFSLLLAIFIDSLGWGVVYPVFSAIFISNNTHIFSASMSTDLRNFYFELIIAIYCLCMFIASPILGSLSDRYGRKIILLISLWGNAIGFFISAIGIPLNSLILIILGRIVSGLTAGNLTIAQAAIVDTSTADNKAQRLGWIGIANGVGFACGPAIGSLILSMHFLMFAHYQLAFYISALLAIAGSIFVLCYFHETFSRNTSQKIDMMTDIRNIFDSFRTKTRAYCLAMLCFMLGWNIFFNEIPVFLHGSIGAQGASIGYFMTYVAAIYALSLLALLPYAIKKLGIQQLILISLIMQMIFQLLFPAYHHWLYFYIVVTPLAIAVPFAYVGITTAASNLTDSQHQGKIMGVIGSIIALTWGIGPLLTAFLSKKYYTDPYFASITTITLALIIIIQAIIKHKKAQY